LDAKTIFLPSAIREKNRMRRGNQLLGAISASPPIRSARCSYNWCILRQGQAGSLS
jgi:hypothetical protein